MKEAIRSPPRQRTLAERQSTAVINISVQSLTSFWSMTGNINMNPDSNFVGNVDSVPLVFRTKDIERMRIDPNGNVGIGVDTPSAQLHTTGTVRFAGLTGDSTKTRVLVSDRSGNLFFRNVSSLRHLPVAIWGGRHSL